MQIRELPFEKQPLELPQPKFEVNLGDLERVWLIQTNEVGSETLTGVRVTDLEVKKFQGSTYRIIGSIDFIIGERRVQQCKKGSQLKFLLIFGISMFLVTILSYPLFFLCISFVTAY